MPEKLLSTPADLARVQAALTLLPGWEAILDDVEQAEPDFLRVLLTGVGVSWLPNPTAVEYLMLMPRVRTVVAGMWDSDLVFNDDEGFSTARFMLLLADMILDSKIDATALPLALAQLRRMFAMGRVDVAYLVSLPGLYTASTAVDFALLLAHDIDLAAKLQPVADLAETASRADGPLANQFIRFVGLDLNVAVIVAAFAKLPDLRGELFRERWLRAYLAPAEYVDSVNLGISMLRELYPQVWAAGYVGYRALVTAG